MTSISVDVPVTLVGALRRQAQERADLPACTFLHEGEEAGAELTFGSLDKQARAIAARLQGLGVTGECAVLLYPPGLEFLSAFFGCLYAGVIAVPLPVPRMRGSTDQFLGIVKEVPARVVMTTRATMAKLDRLDLLSMDGVPCLASEDTDLQLARAWHEPHTAADAVAYLQYTSGSTACRKGVAITHASVLANLRGIAERFRHHERSVSVTWLPHTHDLGLVGGILQPLYHGHLNVLMSPAVFVQQPARWLAAISRFRGTYACSPNFGYDLCIRRTTPEQRGRLDLSSWVVALNGAEPVRQDTIDAFVDLFAPCGFRREAMYPAYGLAEATLVVSGADRGREPVFMRLDAGALERDRVVEPPPDAPARVLVGCGPALDDTTVHVVDPVTYRPVPNDSVGEIWVHGPGVAPAYWRQPEATNQTFRARIADSDGPTFLRTGDLGFIRGNEVFVTGRLKDLIIVRGGNHYPQDIESTVERSHPAFRPGCCAAFSVDADGTEAVVVAVEVEREHLRTVDGEALTRIARKAVADEHELRLQTLVLLRTGTMPRTTSGKVQRRQCRSDFLTDRLAVVWASPEASTDNGLDAVPTSTPATTSGLDVSGAAAAPRPAADQLVTWLRDYAESWLNSRLMDQRRSVTPHVLLDFGNQGILGLQAPRGAGGLELGHRDALRVIEQLGAIDQTLAMMTIVHNALGLGPILAHATDTLKADVVPRLATGRELAAFAITEPAAGSNPQAIVSTAVPDGTEAWRLHGRKSWSGTAGWASVINVFAQNIDEQGRPRGLSGFVVPRGTPGLRIGPEALTLGMRAMVQNTVYLEGARVTSAQRLGEVGGGLKVAQDAMMQGRLQIAAASVGGIKRCLQLLVRYASRRSVSTGPLIDNPVVLDRVGTLTAVLASLEALIHRVAQRLDAGQDVPVDAYIVCKTAGSEWLWRAADDLVQFLGGRGYIETNVAAQLLRDARVTRILEGPTEALTMFLGTRVVNDGAPLRRFLIDEFGATAMASRLAEVAQQVCDRCTSSAARFDHRPAALRWAYALVGQIATEALLHAATPQQAPPHVRAWAERRLDASISQAMEQASGVHFRLSASDVTSLSAGYAASIGDVEQSLQGEDDTLDDMLKRQAPAHVPVAEQSAAPAETHSEPAQPVPVRPDAPAIEQFIRRRVAKELRVPEASIDPSRSFFDYGLDSVTTVLLTSSLEEWLNIVISPEIVYDIPVIRDFAAYLQARRDETITHVEAN